MTQQGTIKKILPGGMAEIEVVRRSACGHDCAKCGGCGGLETQTLYVTARNRAQAQVGERVLIEGETRKVLGLAVLVYMLPIALFFLSYALGAVLGLSEGLSSLCGCAGFSAGILAAVLYSRKMRKKNEAPYEIVKRI